MSTDPRKRHQPTHSLGADGHEPTVEQIVRSWTARSANGMTKPTADQVVALGAALQAFARRSKLADAGSSEEPLNELDLQTLLYVAQHPDCGPTDIARYLGLAATAISSATDRLAKKGLLERHRIEGDRRAVALRLSKDGAARAAAQVTAYNALNLTLSLYSHLLIKGKQNRLLTDW